MALGRQQGAVALSVLRDAPITNVDPITEHAAELDTPISPDDALFSLAIPPATQPSAAGSVPAQPASSKAAGWVCAYRTFSRKAIGNATTPRLKGFKVAGRWAVIYSPD